MPVMERTRPLKLELVTAPTETPVSVDEAKTHCRVDHAADDAWFTTAIKAATGVCENLSDRAFCTQTWRLKLDAWPDGEELDDTAIVMPRARLSSVTSVKYADTAGVQQTLAGSEYVVDATGEPGRIYPAYGKSWPSIREHVSPIEVVFVAGYGGASAVPAEIKQALLMLVSHWYDHRDSVTVGTINSEMAQALEHQMNAVRTGVLR